MPVALVVVAVVPAVNHLCFCGAEHFAGRPPLCMASRASEQLTSQVYFGPAGC